MSMHGFTKLFLQPGETSTKFVWLSVAVKTPNEWNHLGKWWKNQLFFLSNEKADGVNRSTAPYHWRLNEWLPFSELCRSPSKVKWVYPADPVPLFNHKHDLICFLLCSWTEWTTQAVKVEAESKRKQKMLKGGGQTRQIFWKQDDNMSHSAAQGIAWQRPQSWVSGEKAEQMGITIFEEIEPFSWPTSPTETKW